MALRITATNINRININFDLVHSPSDNVNCFQLSGSNGRGGKKVPRRQSSRKSENDLSKVCHDLLFMNRLFLAIRTEKLVSEIIYQYPTNNLL